jgi:hypothetical protein
MPPSSGMVSMDEHTKPQRTSLQEVGGDRSQRVLAGINKIQEKIIYFSCLSVNYNYNNRSPAVYNDSQTVFIAVGGTSLYIVKNNVVARLYF